MSDRDENLRNVMELRVRIVSMINSSEVCITVTVYYAVQWLHTKGGTWNGNLRFENELGCMQFLRHVYGLSCERKMCLSIFDTLMKQRINSLMMGSVIV